MRYIPNGLVLLSSYRCRSSRKYFASGFVLLMHCTPEFMKQVFPRLLNPEAPGTIVAETIKVT